MPGLISRVLRPQNIEITTSQELSERLRAGEPTWAGVEITESTALTIATVWACTRVIAEDIGKLPFPVYRRVADGDRERAPTTRAWTLIHDRPNSWQTSQQFREQLTVHALLGGNGYALPTIVRGEVRELIPVMPRQVRIEVMDDGEPVYHVALKDGLRTVPAREMFHIRGISRDGVRGESVITLARESFGLSRAMQRHAGTFFGNKATPGGVLKHPANLSAAAQERLKEQVEEVRRSGSWSTLLLEEGMDWLSLGMSMEDAQWIMGTQFQVEEICRWFRVPPHKVSHLLRSTFSNIEHQSIEYVTDTLLSWAKRWEAAIGRTVLHDPHLYAEINLDALLRGDTKSRSEAQRIAVGGPWKTRAEARREENLRELDQEGLDHVITPLNVDAGDPGAPGSTDPEREVRDAS